MRYKISDITTTTVVTQNPEEGWAAEVVIGEESGGGMTAGWEWRGSRDGDAWIGAENREDGLICCGG
jgi:hypothetical protein